MTEEIKDPTLTGPVGLKGIESLLRQSKLAATLKLLELLSMSSRDRVAVANSSMAQDLTLQADEVGFGDSSYDSTGGIDFLENVNETRALNQPWAAKIGAGVLKGTALAATTFLDTFVGTAMGLINAAATGSFSGMWDNPVTQGFNAINANLEKALPNYYTEEETKNKENGEWYKNIFTSNFIGDTLIKNAGFMVGAALSGKVVAGAAAKMMKLGDARKAYEGYAVIGNDGRLAATLTEKLKMIATGNASIDGAAITQEAMLAAKKLRSANQQLQLIGATSGALGESRLEAVSNSKEFADRLTQQLTDSLPALVEEETVKLESENPNYLELDGTLTEEAKQVLKERVDERYEQGLAKIEELRTKYGNRDFITNFALLSGSNFVLFGRMYAGGFKNATRSANLADDVLEGGIKGVKAVKPSILKKAWSVAKMPLTEGPVEEMGLATIAKTLNQYYGAEFNSLMGHLIDPNANKEAIDWLNAIGQGAKETYGTMAGWEEGFVGALIGGIGMPSVVKKANANGKPSHALIMNGAIGEVQLLNKNYKEDQELASELNTRFQDPKFLEYYKALVRRNSLEADKQTALDAKDEFEFKNAEHSALISDAILFDKTGRILDLYDHIESFGNLSDEDITGIRLNLTSKEKKSLPYLNKTDEELKQYFKDKAKVAKETVDTYRLIADDLAVKSGDTFKGDDLAELTWMLTKIDNWEKRFAQIHEKVLKDLKPIIKQLNGGVYTDNEGIEHPIDEVLNQSPLELLMNIQTEGSLIAKLIDKLKSQLNKKADKALANVLVQELQLDLKTDTRGLTQVLGKLDRLKKELKKNLKALKNSNEIIKDINDLTRIVGARTAFLERYNMYIANPERLKLDLKKIEVEAKKELTKVESDEIKELKDIVDTFTTYELYKEHLNQLDAEATKKGEKFDVKDFNNSFIRLGNKFAIHHEKLSLDAGTVKKNINNAKVSSDTKEAANIVFARLLKGANTKEELFDLKKASFKELYEDIILKNNSMLDPEEIKRVQTLVKKALVNALIDSKNRADAEEVPFSWTPEDGSIEPIETITEDSPSKDLVPVTPLSNEPTSSYTPPVDTPKAPVEENPEPDIVDVGGKKAYYFNPFPEFDINEKKKGIFTPSYVKYPKSKEIWEYFDKKGTWRYLNELNVKEGDTIGFMIDPAFRRRRKDFADVIFLTHGPDNQIIGSLHGDAYAKDYVGLLEMKDRIEKEFAETGLITETTTIGLMNSGYVELSRGIDHDLKGVPKVVKDKLVFAIASHGLEFFFNHPTISKHRLVAPEKPGMIYLYTEAADGNWMPAPCTTKTFNREEFNRNDITTLNNPRFKKIDEAVDILANATQPEDVTDGRNKLAKQLFFGEDKKDSKNLNISADKKIIKINLSNDKTQIIIKRFELNEDGILKELWYDTIFLTEKDDNPNKLFDLDENGVVLKNLTRNSIESIKESIYNSLYKNDIIFNIDANEINQGTYNEEIYESNLLKTALVEGGVKTVWFYLLAKTPQGTPIPFEAPAVVREETKLLKFKPVTLPKVNPVTLSESVIKGTEVEYKGETYFVDSNDVVNAKGEPVKGFTKNVIIDVAYIEDGLNGKFGDDFIKNHRVSVSKFKLADGRIFDKRDNSYEGLGDVRNLKAPIDKKIETLIESKVKEYKVDSPSPSTNLPFELDLDPAFTGSFGEVATDFKNSETNAPKNLELSKKVITFVELDENTKKVLTKKGVSELEWNKLTIELQQHELKCING